MSTLIGTHEIYDANGLVESRDLFDCAASKRIACIKKSYELCEEFLDAKFPKIERDKINALFSRVTYIKITGTQIDSIPVFDALQYCNEWLSFYEKCICMTENCISFLRQTEDLSVMGNLLPDFSLVTVPQRQEISTFIKALGYG